MVAAFGITELVLCAASVREELSLRDILGSRFIMAASGIVEEGVMHSIGA